MHHPTAGQRKLIMKDATLIMKEWNCPRTPDSRFGPDCRTRHREGDGLKPLASWAATALAHEARQRRIGSY